MSTIKNASPSRFGIKPEDEINFLNENGPVTVGELIQMLESLPQDASVMTARESFEVLGVKSVSVDEHGESCVMLSINHR